MHPRPARLLRLHGLGRAQRRDRQPARARRGGRARLERELPRPAARVRARRARDGRRRAREHLRAARRAARQSEPLRRAAGVPHERRRPQHRVHDPAVRRGLARLREQGALPSRDRRLDPDERRPGGSRVDGQRRRVSRRGRCSRTASASRDRAARRRAGGRVPRAARARARRARDARRRARAVAAPARRPVALARHRSGRGRDPRRLDPRGGRDAR